MVYTCSQPKMEIYVNDAYSSVSGQDNTIWKNVSQYVHKLNEYYINNKLINNLQKTKIMLISNNEKTKAETIELENKKQVIVKQ